MSRQTSQSPRYRRFPWDEPDFDPHKVIAELDRMPLRSPYSGGDPEEHWDSFRDDTFPEGQRRSPPVLDDNRSPRERQLENFYHRRMSPFCDTMRYGDRGFSPEHNEGREEDRWREKFRERSENFEKRVRSSQSPLRLQRERLLLSPRSQLEQPQTEQGMGWRREDHGRGRERFRDFSPSGSLDDHTGGAGRERGQRNIQSPNRNRRRENPHQERSTPVKRHRREMDDTGHFGYGKEEKFGEQRCSVDTPRGGLAGDAQGDILHSGMLIVEHGHGIDNRDAPRREHLDKRRDHDFNRPRSPQQSGFTKEPVREPIGKPNRRSHEREHMRGTHFQDDWNDRNFDEARSSPFPQDEPNPLQFANRKGPMNHSGKRGHYPIRGKFNRGGRGGPHRNQPRFQQSSQEYQNSPHEQRRQAYQPFKEDRFEEPTEEMPVWEERGSLKSWGRDEPRNVDRHLSRKDLDPKMPRSREKGWNTPKTNNLMVVTEETLTIKVDMSRPLNQNSPLCYSSDRQLSLDLVNVGRQRLDFLPMLEHSGTYRETATHTGTFAQEIITLVHQVKDQYFRGNDVTLNERFSTPQKGNYSEEVLEELTLDQRFSSNRGFSLNDNSLHDDEPLFSRPGAMQGLGLHPVRDPGDLRHDLERRRQERLEGVKVTIQGNSLPQHPIGPAREQPLEYIDKDERSQMKEGFSNWSGDPNGRREGHIGPRRGAPYRQNTGPQRRNNRLGHRLGPFRRQNYHNNKAGQSW